MTYNKVMNDDNKKKLYDALSSTYDLGDFQKFSTDVEDETKRRKLYDAIKEEYDLPDFEGFTQQLGVGQSQSPSSEQGFVISQSQLDQEEPGAVETNREVSSPAKPTKLPNPNFMGIAEQGRRGVQQTLNAVKFQQANRGFDVKPVKLGENRHVVEQTNLNPQTGKFEKSYITESGNEYSEEEKAFANLEQGNIDEYKFSQSVEGQLRSAYDELERLKEEYNKAIQDAGKYQQIDMQGNILGISDEDAYIKASQRASNIKSAIQLTERRIASMEEVRKRRGVENYNAKEKVKDFGRGFWDLTTDPDTWLFGLPGLNTSIKLTQAFNKAKNGEELSDDEKWLLDAEAANNSAESMYGDEKGRFYRYGNITAQALPFVVEFLTTKGGFRGLSKSISGAVEKGLASNIENAAARWMVKNTGVLAGDMARAVAMANSTGAAKTASDILSRHLGQIGKDGNGNYYAQNAKDLWRSIYEGEMAQVFEYFTEMLGNHMNMGKWLAKGANKINLKKLSKAITYLTKNDFLNYVGVQDYPSEVMEEQVNLILNALFVGDNNFSTGPLKELANKWFGKDYKVNKDSDEYRESIFNPQTQGDIIGGMFYSIGLMKAPKFLMDAPGLAQHAYNFAQYKRYEHNVDAADKVASFRFTPENWEPIREQINNATNDQMGGVINSILQDKDLSTQEKQAAMDYVGNLLKMRGFNTALMTYQKNQARDGQEPDVQEKVGQEIAKSEMEGYEAREPEEMQDVQNLMTIKREALEEVAEPGLVASLDENPVEALRNLYDEYRNSEDVSNNILSLATDYVNARMRYNGMVNRISDDIDSNIQVARAQIDSNVDQHTNQIRPAILKQGERPVYIVDDTNQSDDASIIVKDAETGKVEFVSPRDIASIGEALDPEQEKLRVETEVRNQIAQQEIDKANGTLPMAVNDVYELIDEEGKPHQVQIVADNGDGTVQAVVDGKPNEAFPKQVIQDMADLKNRARAQELANAGSSDIEPMSSDGSPMPSQEEAEANENELNEETNGGITNTSEIEVRSPMPMKGEEPDFISVTPERGYQFLSEESQWSPEEVSEFVSNNQKAAQQALAKAQEKKPKMGISFAKFNADKAVYADNVAKAKQVADYWDSVANLDAVNKQRRDEEAQRQLWSTPEGREQSLANAKNEKEKQALAKQIYGSYLNDDFYFPDTIEELVSMQLPYNGLAWESYTIGTKPIRGLKEELGSNKRRGVGRQFDTNAFNSYLAKNGEGRSVDNMAEMMYMSPENLPDGENPRWEVQEIRDAILDMLMSASKSTDIKDYVLNSRIENAERSMRAEEDQIAMDRAEYARSMNIAPEELALLEEYLKAEIPRLAEAYEEFYRNFVPEETETQDSNGTEQIAGSASVDSESAEGGSNELVAGSEGEVRGTARGEEAGAVDNEPSGTDGEAEGDTSGQPVPDNNVPEGERITLQEQIAEAEAETDTNPTEAQKEAGNYKKGHVNIDGFDVTIENPKGSVRSGVDAGGKAWSQTMNNTYGYIRGTEGVDGDHIDMFLSDDPSQGDVYVIDQVNKDGSFDEHKVMYGFGSEQEARDAYLSNYEEGWQGLGNITHVSKEEFKKWVDSSHRKTKPFADYKSVKTSADEEENRFAEAVEQFQNETPEEFVEFNRSVPDMSDDELLGYIGAMGYDETKAAHPVVYDEYDARHSSEYNSYYDMYESAFDDDMSREQIEETLSNAEKEWREGGFAGVQRTQLSAQIDTAREWLDAHPVITPDNIADYKDVIFSRMRNGKVKTAKIKDIKNGEVTYDLNGKEHKSSVDNYVRALNNPEEGWRVGRMFNLRFREGEEDEIEEKAKANGTWLKAPNGKKSNLTPKQWVQTRLEDFIEYFGDWQKAARIDKLRNSENAVITGNEIDLSGKDKKKAALQYGKTLQGTYTNADTGAVIQLQRGRRNGGINEVLQHNYKDIEHLQSVAAIPQIIEKSIYISSEENHDKKKNPDVAEYQHYVCGLKIGDIDYTVHAIVAVDNKGNRYYDHNLVHIEKGKLLDQINGQAVKNGFGTTPDTKSTTNSAYKFNALVSLLQTNASKIVDENGEPMVVYHGDKAKGRYVFTPNTFFTGKEDYAGRYTRGTGEVGAYFLNIRKPFDIRDEESHKIFTEYRNGHEPSPTASGAMDWADYDYDDLQEYLEENYPDKYDGFILDEGGDGGYGNEVTARGLSYIPFYPEQIKSATENNGEFSRKNKDVRFREGNDKTLAGFHNISSEKLRKALKLGGLANPSMAVINTEDRAHTDYGDISLIAPSRLIDARTGKNVGTYAGDAWTPTYPSVTLFLTAKGEKHRQAIAKENADGNKELENHLLHGLADYIDDSADRLHFLFLKQKGLNPEIASERITHSHEEYEAVQKILGEDASTLPSDFTKEQSDALLDLMMSEYEKQVREDAKKISDEAKREAAVEAMLNNKRQSLTDENGKLWFAKGDTYVNSVWRDEQRRNNPKPDWYRTDNDASYRVAKEGLSEEYQKWKEQLFNDEDIEEKIFTGYTSDGRRKYIPNTLENVSRLMNKEQNTNAYSNGGLSATRASLLQKFTSLAQIRKNKDMLKGDEEVQERNKEMSDELFDIISQISDLQVISDNQFINLDYAERRLQEALTMRNPIQYLNREYGYDIAGDSDLASQIMNFIEEVKALPVKYFETKFNRPVYLNEFAVAVVPDDLDEETMNQLRQSGLDIRTYKAGDEQDRKRANKEAVEGRSDILFREGNEAPIFISNARKAVEDIKQEKATPEQWLAMIQKNGGLKAGEDKWLGLSDWLKSQEKKTLTKQEVLDYIRENQIQIEEEEYGELELQQLQDEFDEIYDRIVDGVESDEVVSYPAEQAWEELKERHDGGDDFDLAFSLDDHLNIEINDELAAGYFLGKNPINSTRLDYTTEGLGNKQEIALVVPTIESWNEDDDIHFGDAGYGRAIAWIRFGDTVAKNQKVRANAQEKLDALMKFMDEMQDKYGMDVWDASRLNKDEAKEFNKIKGEYDIAKKAYMDSSSDDRVLVIDEIQSKRHQEGRENGYKVTEEKAVAEMNDFLDRMRNKYHYKPNEPIIDYFNDEEMAELDRLNAQQNDASFNYSAVPDAPFDKNWHELAMKRMLRYAAENGYDKIAWTKGNQQAERYDIGQQVDEIRVYDLSDGTHNVQGFKNGNRTFEIDTHDGEQGLASVVGKELARKAYANLHEGVEDNLVDNDYASFKGNDLMVGGAGMRGFYDEILPRFMNKYGKKWGVKVEDIELPNVEEAGRHMWAIDVTPEMKESVMQGQTMFRQGGLRFGDEATFNILLTPDLDGGPLVYKTEALPDGYPSPYNAFQAVRNHYPEYLVEYDEEHDKIRMTSWESILGNKEQKPASKKQQREKDAYAKRVQRNMRRKAEDMAEKLHITEDVLIVDNASELPDEVFEGMNKRTRDKAKRSKGWFDPVTGKIIIIVGNNRSEKDILETILHEGVAHYGLRKLFAEHFDTFLDEVYKNAVTEVKDRINRLALEKYNFDLRAATEEYLASLAEVTDFEHPQVQSWWKPIRDLFAKMLKRLGLGQYTDAISDNELRYILWRSYHNLELRGAGVFGVAEDMAKQQELKVEPFAEEKKEETAKPQEKREEEETPQVKGIRSTNGDNLTKDEKNKLVALHMDFKEKRGDDVMLLFHLPQGYVLIGNDAEMAQRMFRLGQNSYTEFDESMLDMVLPRLIASGNRVAIMEVDRRNMVAEDNVPVGKFDSALKELDERGISINNKDLLDGYNLKNLILDKSDDIVKISAIVTKEQGKGDGTRFMNDLLDIADRKGWILALTPDTSFGGSSVSRLKNFYKRFGFKDNKGRNTNFATRESMVRPPMSDRIYEDAVNRGDMETATAMLREKLAKAVDIIPYVSATNYSGPHIDIAKQLKESDAEAIAEAASNMVQYIPDNAVLIPIPPHEGKVTEDTDTMKLAQALAEMKGVPVMNILEGNERESRYAAKQDNRKGVTADEMGFRKTGELPEGKIPIFIDNVVGTGETAKAASQVFGGGITLSYAKSNRSKSVKGLKNAVVTYDDNGKLIPLSKRFNPNKRDVRFRDGDEGIRAKYGLVGGCINQVIDSKEELDKMLSVLPEEHVKEIMKQYNTPGILGCYSTELQLAITFADKCRSEEQVEQNQWHEQTHHVFEHLDMPDKMEAADEVLKLLKNEDPALYDFITGKYDEAVWSKEAVSYFVEELVGIYGAEKFLNKNGHGNEKIVNLVTEIQNTFKYGTEGRDFLGLRQRLQEDKRRQEQESRGDNPNGEDTDGRREGEYLSEVGRTEQGESREEGNEEIDSFDAGPLTFDESISKALLELAKSNKQNLQARMDAIDSIRGNLQQIRMAMARQREYDRSTINDIVRLVRMLMKAGYVGDMSPYEVRRLLAMVNSSTGREDLTKQADKIVNLVSGNQLKQCKDILNKLISIRASKTNQSGVEIQGKLSVEGQRIVMALRDGKELDTALIEERIQKALDRMADAKDEVGAKNAALEYQGLLLAKQYIEDIKNSEIEEKELKADLDHAEEERKNGAFSSYEAYKEYVAGLNDSIMQNRLERIESYRRMFNAIGAGLRDSVVKAQEFREREVARANEIRHLANSDLQGESASEHSDNKWWENSANWSLVRFLMKPLASFDEMLRFVGRKSVDGKGYLWNRFFRNGVVPANDKAKRNLYADHKRLDEKVRELFNGGTYINKNGKEVKLPKINRWSDLFALERDMPSMDVTIRDLVDDKTYKLSAGNLLYIYMVNKMTDGYMKLRRMGITEADVNTIERFLDPRLVQLADWIQSEFLVDKRKDFNAVHERLFGAPMASIDNYFPLKINSRSRGQEVDPTAYTGDSDVKPSEITGSIIKRRRNSLPLDITHADAFDVVLEHLEQMEHWAAFAELSHDLKTLLSYKIFRNRLKNMSSARFGSGDVLWNNFKTAAAIAVGVYRPKLDKDSIDTSLVNIAKGVTVAKISLRLYTAFKQLLSYPAYFAEANPIELLKTTNPVGAVKAWNWAIENLPGFAERWLSRQAGDTRLKQTDSDWQLWRNDIVQKLMRFGMSPNAAVDALTVCMGAKAIYETKLKQYKNDGYDEAKAKEMALRDASIAYNETQQSSESGYVSAMQLDRSVASVALSVFRNASIGYQRRFFRALDNLKQKAKKGYKEESIAFMTKQMERDGLPHDKAQKAAERMYNRSWVSDIVNVLVFGYYLQFLWNLASYLPYLLFGDDDDKKKEFLEDAAIHAFAGGVEGLSGGSIISELANMTAQMAMADDDSEKRSLKQQLGNYNFNTLPIMSDIQNTLRHFSNDEVAGWDDVVNLIMQSGFGVNPQTILDVALAIEDACHGDMEMSKEVAMLLMRIAAVPQSQLEELYLDEVGLTADEAKELSVSELAQRYATYKRKRGAYKMQWAYDDEEKAKIQEKYEKRFQKRLQERIAGMEEEEQREAFETADEAGDIVLKNLVGKELAKTLGSEDEFGNKATEPWQEEYQRLRSVFDYADDIRLNNAAKEAKEANDEARMKQIAKMKSQLNKIRKGLALDVEGREERMNMLRDLRSKYLDALDKKPKGIVEIE